MDGWWPRRCSTSSRRRRSTRDKKLGLPDALLPRRLPACLTTQYSIRDGYPMGPPFACAAPATRVCCL